MRKLEKKLVNKIKNKSQQSDDNNLINKNSSNKFFTSKNNKKNLKLIRNSLTISETNLTESLLVFPFDKNNNNKGDKLPLSSSSLISPSSSQSLLPSSRSLTPLNFAALIGLNHEISGISHITAPKLLSIEQDSRQEQESHIHSPVAKTEAPAVVPRLNRYGGYAPSDLDSNRNSIGLCNDQLISDNNQDNLNHKKEIQQNFVNESGYDSHDTNSDKNIINVEECFPIDMLISSNQALDENIFNAKNNQQSHSILNVNNDCELPIINNIQESHHIPEIKKLQSSLIDIQSKNYSKYESVIDINCEKTQKTLDDNNLNNKESIISLNQINNSLENISDNKKKKSKKIVPKILKMLGLPKNNQNQYYHLQPPAKPKRQRRSFHLQIQPKSLQSLNEIEPYDTDIISWWKNGNDKFKKNENALHASNIITRSEPHLYRQTCLNNAEVVEFLQCRVKETKYVTAVFESANKGLLPVLVDIEQEFRHWLGPKSLLLAVACEVHWSVPERFRSRIVEIK